MERVNFIFVLHFHQPVGQLKWVNDRVFENSYKLLLDIFKEFADLKFTIHISGPLLQYMMEYYSDWLDEIAKLNQYGVFEFLAGSLSESILPLIPYDDRVEQIREYIRLFEKIFGFKPKGLWLPERVWEPSLPEPLAKNGIEYVFIDDSTLYRSGRGSPDNLYAWITEESGYKLKVFFIDTGLRYILPWKSSGEVVNYMLSKADVEGNRVLVWGSDAEKFGEWADPGWSRWWLRTFLNDLRMLRDRVTMIHPSEYLLKHGVKGLIYLNTGSYDKMLEWSGGFFRNFLVKYRESNNMHKKMLWVRKKLLEMPYRDEDAWRHYYLAQCNDVYWHGLFGGIYLSHLRQAVYENLLTAERIAEERINYYSVEPVIHKTDFDYDGRDELLIERKNVNVYIKPDDGGTVFEFDVKTPGFEHNVQDTMTRYMESYLEGTGFNPDWYRRVSCRIHLWDVKASIHDWVNNTPFIDRSDLALRSYSVALTPEKTIVLRTIGYHYNAYKSPLFVEKRINVNDQGYDTVYVVENRGEQVLETVIGLEYHVAPKINRYSKDDAIRYIIDVEHGVNEYYTGVSRRVVVKTSIYPDIILESNTDHEIWVAPIYSRARTEKGLLDVFQGIGVLFIDRVSLKPGDRFETLIKHYVNL